MTECPFIPSNANRLAQPHRRKPLVRSDLGSRVQSANRQRPRLILRQPRLRNAETVVLNLKNNVTPEASGPTHSALSP